MKALLAPLACLVAGSALAQDSNDIQLEQYWFVFLFSGQKGSLLDELAQAEGMKAHLGNLTRLAQEGKCVAAGPFLYGKELRGIVLLKVERVKTA